MFAALLKLRIRLARVFSFFDTHSIFIWAGLIGVAAAFTTEAFRGAVGLLQSALTGHSGSLVEMAKSLPWQTRMVLPAAGGAVAGAQLVYARRFSSGAASDYMEAISLGDGRVPVRVGLRTPSSFRYGAPSPAGGLRRRGRHYFRLQYAASRGVLHHGNRSWLDFNAQLRTGGRLVGGGQHDDARVSRLPDRLCHASLSGDRRRRSFSVHADGRALRPLGAAIPALARIFEASVPACAAGAAGPLGAGRPLAGRAVDLGAAGLGLRLL